MLIGGQLIFMYMRWVAYGLFFFFFFVFFFLFFFYRKYEPTSQDSFSSIVSWLVLGHSDKYAGGSCKTDGLSRVTEA